MLKKANVAESAAYLKEKLPFVPEIALVRRARHRPAG